MGWKGTLREREAAERRQQREAHRRFRELERQSKEQAKLSAIEQARLEVETFDNRLEVLLSIHKEQGDAWDWTAIAASLPPPCPQRNSYHEQKARLRAVVRPVEQREASQVVVRQARLEDEQEFENTTRIYSEQMAQLERRKSIARRILDGEYQAYIEALVEFNPFAEMSDLGSAIHFTVHSAKLIECVLKVNGRQAIPAEVKTLTSSGNVSVKPMPKGRFQEIYQHYLCSCVLRVAREVFALLPVDALLVTAALDSLDTRTGQTGEQSVLSVCMPRTTVARLDFDRLDPSDAIGNFRHRGDFKATRKSEVFQPITPLTAEDITQDSIEDMGFDDLLASTQRMREELKSKIAELRQRHGQIIAQNSGDGQRSCYKNRKRF